MGNWFLGKSRRKGYVGITHSHNGYAAAYLDVNHKTKQCQVGSSIGIGRNSDPALAPDINLDQVKNWIKDQSLSKAFCNYVLASDEYQVHLLEAPGLSGEELKQAMSWQVKDLLNYPVSDAVIDVIELPAELNRGDKNMVYVVSAERKTIAKIINDVDALGLNLISIDICELALGNLVHLLGCDERGEGLVVVKPGSAELSMFRNGQMTMTRSFDLPFSALEGEMLPTDVLLLELQRTLDYYERQLGQLMPRKIHLTGGGLSSEVIDPALYQGLASPIELMNLENRWFKDELPSGEQNFSVLAAIGGAVQGLQAEGLLSMAPKDDVNNVVERHA